MPNNISDWKIARGSIQTAGDSLTGFSGDFLFQIFDNFLHYFSRRVLGFGRHDTAQTNQSRNQMHIGFDCFEHFRFDQKT
jgi:hypothetical protein